MRTNELIRDGVINAVFRQSCPSLQSSEPTRMDHFAKLAHDFGIAHATGGASSFRRGRASMARAGKLDRTFAEDG